MALNNNNPIPYYESTTNKSCKQSISFTTKEKVYKGLKVYEGNEADFFNKKGTVSEISKFIESSKSKSQDIKIVTEGEVESKAEVEFENNKLVVKKTGSLTGLAIYYNDDLVELFTFIDAYDKKNVGIFNLFLIWKNKPEIIEYKRSKNHENNKYYKKSLKGGWFTFYERKEVFSAKSGEWQRFSPPHDDLTQNLIIEGKLFPGQAGTGLGVCGKRFQASEGISWENIDFIRKINQQSWFSVNWNNSLTWGYSKNFLKIKQRIASETVTIPLNWSKLDAEGNPIEDFYGRSFSSNECFLPKEENSNCKGIQVEVENSAYIFTKTNAKITDFEIQLEGTAILFLDAGKIKVIKSGNLTGLSVLKDGNQIDYFSFIEGSSLGNKNLGVYNHYLKWKQTVKEYNYFREKESFNSKYYLQHLSQLSKNWHFPQSYNNIKPFVLTGKPSSFVLKGKIIGKYLGAIISMSTGWGLFFNNSNNLSFVTKPSEGNIGDICSINYKELLPSYKPYEMNYYEFWVSLESGNIQGLVKINDNVFHTKSTGVFDKIGINTLFRNIQGELIELKAWDKKHSIKDMQEKTTDGLFISLDGSLDENNNLINEVGSNATSYNLRSIPETLKVPLNWSKLDEEGNPVEDYYGRTIS